MNLREVFFKTVVFLFAATVAVFGLFWPMGFFYFGYVLGGIAIVAIFLLVLTLIPKKNRGVSYAVKDGVEKEEPVADDYYVSHFANVEATEETAEETAEDSVVFKLKNDD